MADRDPAKGATPSSPRLNRRQALRTTGTGLALAAAAAGVSNRAIAQSATPAATPAAPLPDQMLGTVTPERAALAVSRVREYAEELLAQTGVPGLAVAVVYNDEVLLAEGFGVREIDNDERVDADTVFQLASVSKSLAATVVSSVVGDGAISWDSTLAEIAPGFALADAWTTEYVTLADLFAHRSGLPDHGGDILEDVGFSQAEILHRLRYLTPAYSFRAGYEYTNFGVTAAAEAAATAAGTPWADLSRERLYEPLGMAHTSSLFSDYMEQVNRAIPHVQVDGGWRVTPMQRDPDAQTPAGGVSSTVNDLARWIRLLFGAGTVDGVEVVPAAALIPVHTPQIVRAPLTDPATQIASFYGLGTNLSYTRFGTPQWGHSGAFALGAGTAYYVLPASKFGVVALTNGSPVGVAEALCLDTLDIAQLGAVSRDWLTTVAPFFAAAVSPTYGVGIDWDSPPAPPTPALPSAAYAGSYQNDFYGEAEIVEAEDGFTLRIGPQPREFSLTHYDRDTFRWQPEGENAVGRSPLTFIVGPDGVATSFDDEYLASGGPGTLTKEVPAES
ncbi:MAG: serine hydrolase [Chloroflexota bacterium]|nr:serine hydrolase [Chloroflexota bacterium]